MSHECVVIYLYSAHLTDNFPNDTVVNTDLLFGLVTTSLTYANEFYIYSFDIIL